MIQRLRELLRKGEPTFSTLDLHRLIRDVVKLVQSDAIIRNVSLAVDLGPDRRRCGATGSSSSRSS